MNEQKYILTETELRDLLKSSLILCALSQGGVDDWCWYSDSITDFKEQYKQEHNIETFDEDGYLIEIDMDDITREELKNYKRLYCGDCPNCGARMTFNGKQETESKNIKSSLEYDYCGIPKLRYDIEARIRGNIK